jgi:hypothetical protein
MLRLDASAMGTPQARNSDRAHSSRVVSTSSTTCPATASRRAQSLTASSIIMPLRLRLAL